MSFSALVLGGLLPTVTTNLIATRRAVENIYAYYAADAGVSVVARDLMLAKDALSASYAPPVVNLNGYTATVTVLTPTTSALPGVYYQYADPRVAQNLAPLVPLSDCSIVISNVKPGSDIMVNWAFAPSPRQWRVRIYAGSGTGGTRLTNDSGTSSPGTSVLYGARVSGGAYTVQFSNLDTQPITANAYSTSGGASNTWVWVNAYKDYVIRASADSTTVSVFARQFPGPTYPAAAQSVKLESWRGPL